MKILVVEDEQKTAAYLQKGLTQQGFVVDLCTHGFDGLHAARTTDYDLIILDVMLPGRDGWSILKDLRQQDKQTPVLFLTARDAVEDRVKGLELGADDYLVKPFAFTELLARLRTDPAAQAPARQPEMMRVGRPRNRPGPAPGHPRRTAARSDAQGILALGPPGTPDGRSPVAHADRRAGLGHEFRQRYQRGGRPRAGGCEPRWMTRSTTS